MSIPQCQGGWCTKREHCAHYHARGWPGRPPTDRLCETGRSDAYVPRQFIPVRAQPRELATV